MAWVRKGAYGLARRCRHQQDQRGGHVARVLKTVVGVHRQGGGVAGAQFGAAMGSKLRGEETRALLGLLVLSVAAMLLWQLVRTPESPFVIGPA